MTDGVNSGKDTSHCRASGGGGTCKDEGRWRQEYQQKDEGKESACRT